MVHLFLLSLILGADRDWVSIYEESERLLYLEIDYLNEATNCERFARDFSGIDWVRVPEVYRDVSTPRVLTMEFVESFDFPNTLFSKNVPNFCRLF